MSAPTKPPTVSAQLVGDLVNTLQRLRHARALDYTAEEIVLESRLNWLIDTKLARSLQ